MAIKVFGSGDGQASDWRTLTWVRVGSPEQWQEYKEICDALHRGRHNHYGEPERYPCLARSRNEDFAFLRHEFVYQEDAARLLGDGEEPLEPRQRLSPLATS